MDETIVSSNKKFKVLIKTGKIPLQMKGKKTPHISACVTINVAGDSFRPFIILPNKASLKGLEEFQNQAYFASSSSGWITKNVFTMFVTAFIADTLHYRLTLLNYVINTFYF